VSWIVLAAAGFFIFSTHQQILSAASSLRAVDLHAREAADTLVDLRVAQQAYVASGQGVAFWMPKVAATRTAAAATLTTLRESSITATAKAAIDEAAAAINEFTDVDKRARDYIRSGQALMAGDVIFTEGGQVTSVAARQVETARQAEHQEYDAREAQIRRQQAMAGGGAVALTAFVALVLALGGGRSPEEAAVTATAPPGALKLPATTTVDDEGIVSHAQTVTTPPVAMTEPAAPSPAPPTRNAVMLKTAAELATDFGRVRDSEELQRLLGRAADLMDADGVMVWMGSRVAGADVLRPALAHGYAPNVVARMPSVAKSADNAAAAAYRTGALQVVLSRPGSAAGAIVAPILGATGCIGALSAEIKDGGEGSEAVQAIATIVAAHLAGVLSAEPEANEELRIAK